MRSVATAQKPFKRLEYLRVMRPSDRASPVARPPIISWLLNPTPSETKSGMPCSISSSP